MIGLFWWTSWAAAAEPPYDPEDIGLWQTHARQLLDGPAGCVEFRGDATVKLVLMTPGGLLGAPSERTMVASGPVGGKLDAGTWKGFGPALVDQDKDDGFDIEGVDARPMVGRSAHGDKPDPKTDDAATDAAPAPEQGSVSIGVGSNGTTVAAEQGAGEAVDMLDEILDKVHPATSMAYLEKSGDGFVLVEQADIRGHDEDLEMRTTFTSGGLPTSLDVAFPNRLALGDGLVKVRVMNAQLHLVAQDTALGVLPATESLSAVIAVLGFTAAVEQEIHYAQVRACVADVAPAATVAPATVAPAAIVAPAPATVAPTTDAAK